MRKTSNRPPGRSWACHCLLCNPPEKPQRVPMGFNFYLVNLGRQENACRQRAGGPAEAWKEQKPMSERGWPVCLSVCLRTTRRKEKINDRIANCARNFEDILQTNLCVFPRHLDTTTKNLYSSYHPFNTLSSEPQPTATAPGTAVLSPQSHYDDGRGLQRPI